MNSPSSTFPFHLPLYGHKSSQCLESTLRDQEMMLEGKAKRAVLMCCLRERQCRQYYVSNRNTILHIFLKNKKIKALEDGAITISFNRPRLSSEVTRRIKIQFDNNSLRSKCLALIKKSGNCSPPSLWLLCSIRTFFCRTSRRTRLQANFSQLLPSPC